VGKGTLLERVLEHRPNAWFSVSATTRKPRPLEIEGVHYRFVSPQQFEEWIKTDGLLEWAKVHAGQYYGTPRDPVQEQLKRGNSVFLDIDTQGAFQVMESMPEAVSIFIEPPSIEELVKRLSNRGTESTEQIEGRIAIAEHEIKQRMRYNYQLVNDRLDDASEELCRIVEAEEQ
jgi:guanylate kinase